MLKKALSMLMCVVMVISFFGMTAIETYAAYSGKTLFTTQAQPVNDGKIKYTVSITSGQSGIAGAVIYVKFDNNVLRPSNFAPATTKVNGEDKKNFEGDYIYGITEEDPCMFTVAYMNRKSLESDNVAKAFFTLEFEVIDPSRPLTDVTFYCKEYYSNSEPEKNIYVTDGLQTISEYLNIKTLEIPTMIMAEPYKEGLKVKWGPVEGALYYCVYRIIPYDNDGWVKVHEVSSADALEYYDENLVSGTTYTYAVSAVNYYETDYDTKGASCMFVGKPQIESCVNEYGGVSITWNETKGATYYKIMRRTIETGENGEATPTQWIILENRAASLERKYKDASVEEGKKYEYDVVSATDKYVSPVSEKGAEIIYIPTPEIKGAINILDGIEISWAPVKDATGYTVYRWSRHEQNSSLMPYYDVPGTQTSFVDKEVTAGYSYTYSVQALTDYGKSGYSTGGKTLAHVPSTTVRNLTLEKNSVKIEWNGIDGIHGYKIYRKPTNVSTWTLVASVNKDVLSYSDTSATSGDQYVYAVTPVLGNYEGAKVSSNPVFYIKAPENVIAENEKSGIKLSWNQIQGALEYRVLRLDSHGEYVEIAVVDGNVASYVDKDVSYNNFYEYSVQAINPLGESLYSDKSNKLERLGAMSEPTLKLCEGGIKVSWTPASDANSYVVFRNDGSGWLPTGTSETTEYVDATVKSGVRYSYAVAKVVGDSRGIVDTDDVSSMTYIAPPEKVEVVSGEKKLIVSWSKSEGAVSYEIWRADAENDIYSIVAFADADTLSCTDTSIVPGKTYKYVIRAKNDERTSLDSQPTFAEYLDAPVISKISSIYGGVSITWKKVAGATEYYVCLKNADGRWESVASVDGDTTTYLDEMAINGEVSCYGVRAVSEYGKSDVQGKEITYITAPTLTLSNTKTGISLKWDANEEADSYYIYRRTSPSKGWSRIATVTKNSHTDTKVTAGTTYYYTIKAVKGKITSSYKSDGWSYRFLKIPSHKSLSNGYGSVVFSWNKVAGATGYIVYRKVNGADTWTNLGKTKSTSYTDKDVVNKSNYQYTVRAYYGSSLSSFTAGKVIKYLAAPKLKVSNTASSVKLEWEKVSGASSYYIYRKAGSAKSWTKVATVTRNYYNDTNIKSGVKYTYTIKAYGSKTTSGYYKTGWPIVYLKAPKISSISSKTNGVNIKWNKITGASGYIVYRNDGVNGWENVGKTTANSKVTFVDKTAKKGVTYTYAIRAYRGNCRSAYYSNVKCKVKY